MKSTMERICIRDADNDVVIKFVNNTGARYYVELERI